MSERQRLRSKENCEWRTLVNMPGEEFILAGEVKPQLRASKGEVAGPNRERKKPKSRQMRMVDELERGLQIEHGGGREGEREPVLGRW